MAAAHADKVAAIVADQQKYAAEKGVTVMHEKLLLALIYSKPASPLEFIAAEAEKMAAAPDYEPAWPGKEHDSEAAVAAYLSDNKVHDMLEELFSSVLFSKPAEPAKFIAGEALKMQQQRAAAKASTLYGEADLRAMFCLYDPSCKGAITPAQVVTAYKNLGLKQAPALEAGLASVDVETFVRVARAALAEEKVL